MASEGMNGAFIHMAAKTLEKGESMTQSEADALMSMAMMCNPDGNGYVQILRDDLRKVAPHIDLRD
jgi:hypothetical protein